MKTKIFPTYSFLPLIGLIATHATVYMGTKLLNMDMPHRDLSVALDAQIPFVPEWVFIYVLTFFFWAATIALVMREDKQNCYELFLCVFVAEFICGVFFIVMPTTFDRPVITGDSYAEKLLGVLYGVDTPTNLLPSMHCMMSWMCFRISAHCKNVKKPYVVFSCVMAVLICASTLLVKQHVVRDVIAGVVFGELSMVLGLKWNFLKKLLEKVR